MAASELQILDKPPLEALFRPALILMTGRFLGFVAAFAIPLVMARVFDQSEFGTYKQVFLVFGTVFAIAQAGMAESLYYFLPFESRRSGSYVLNTLLVLGGMASLSLGMLWLWRQELAQLLNNPGLPDYIPLVGVYLLFMLMAVVLEILMTIRKQHLAASCSYALSDLVRAVFYIAPVLVFADLRALMFGAIAFAMARFFVTLVYVKREFGTELRPDRVVLREHLAYAIPFGLAGLIEAVQINFHLYAVSYYFDTVTFAIYAVGCLQIPLSDFLMTSTSNVMMVNMREKIQAGENGAVASIWLDSVRKLGLMFFPLVACLLVIAHPLIVLLFTRSYEASVPIFMVWTLSMLFATLLTDGALRVFAETRFLILQNLIRLGLIVAMIPWFLSHFGVMGAILVTLFATLVSKIIALGRIRFVMEVSLAQLLPWKSLAMTLLIAAVAALPALLVRSVLDAPELVTVAVTGLVYSLSYYVLLLWCGPIQDDEKRTLSRWLQSPLISRLTGVSQQRS